MNPFLELRRLRLFVGVAREGSFSACARSHGLSQPALSRVILQLEDHLGARLFDRDTRTLQLTPAGEALLPIAERLLRDAGLGFDQIAQFIKGGRGRLAIAALPSLAAIRLPAAIAGFIREWPDVDFEVLDGLSERVESAVADGRADLGLAIPPAPERDLDYQEIVQDPFGLVCPHDHPFAQDPAPAWSLLTEAPFIAMSSHSSVRRMTDAAFVQIGTPVQPRYECAHLSTAGALIAQGLGVSALPRLALPLLGPVDLAWTPLSEPALSRSIGIVTRREGTSALARRFADYLAGSFVT
jgi:LysR family carnitine catabolism transcriptional activator